VGLIIGVVLVAAGVILFVMLPVLRGDWASMGRSEDEVTEVDARKQAALRGLRDAEYDYRSGKIDQADYEVLKSDLARQALEAMEEESAGGHTADEGAPTDGAMKRSKGSAAKGASFDADGDRLEAEIARVRKGMAEGRTCPGCGHLNVKKSRFCTGCGERLGEVATTAGNPVSA
jgi:cytochrome c-type biogenesis protein CcmI